MDQPLKANREDGSYIFICYAHADKDAVYPILTWLQNQGFSIWYDAGISPGASWSDELAEAIEGASLFLYLVTPNSANSEHCVSEVNYALDNEVPVLVAHLFETELPKGLKMRLSGKQAVMAYECSDADFRARLLEGVGRNFIPELVMPAQKGARIRNPAFEW